MNGSKWLTLLLVLVAACGTQREPASEPLVDPVAEHGPAVALLGSWAIGSSGRLVEVRCVDGAFVSGYLGERASAGYRRYEASSTIDGLIVRMTAERSSYTVTVDLKEVSSLDRWLTADEIPARLDDTDVMLRRLDAVGAVGEGCSVPWDGDSPALEVYSAPVTLAAVRRTSSTTALTSASVVR